MTIVANVPAGITSDLTCTLTNTAGSGDIDPSVFVQVTGAMGLSVNDLTSGYSNFSIPGP